MTRCYVKSIDVCVYGWRKLIADSHTIFEENLITVNNTGAFYRYVNRRITNHSSVGVIVDHNGTHLSDNALKANAFNIFLFLLALLIIMSSQNAMRIHC